MQEVASDEENRGNLLKLLLEPPPSLMFSWKIVRVTKYAYLNTRAPPPLFVYSNRRIFGTRDGEE